MIYRDIQPVIERNLFKGKAIVLIGPRQVGKTTMLKQISNQLALPTFSINCDEGLRLRCYQRTTHTH